MSPLANRIAAEAAPNEKVVFTRDARRSEYVGVASAAMAATTLRYFRHGK